MKPSYGRVPIDGVILFSESADHVGLFFSDSSFIGPVMQVLIEDWQPVDNQGAPSVLGIPEGPYLYQASDCALQMFEACLGKLEQGGVAIKRIPALENVEEVNEKHRRLVTGEVTRIHATWYSRYADRYRPRTARYFIEGRDISDSELRNLRAQRIAFREELLDVMKKEGLDGWVCPSATNHAPEGLLSTGDPIMNVPWTNSGLPTISLPSGLDEFGLPHGLQLVGKFGQDEHLVNLAMQVEKFLK
jgi:Asp-tRNA(Asn)/Glu-tRNA(Gln) amidotransferase A subunit family amidase